jgi:hypothetical protein
MAMSRSKSGPNRKSPAAVALGKLRAATMTPEERVKLGKARAKKLTKARRVAIAKKAAEARWARKTRKASK